MDEKSCNPHFEALLIIVGSVVIVTHFARIFAEYLRFDDVLSRTPGKRNNFQPPMKVCMYVCMYQHIF